MTPLIHAMNSRLVIDTNPNSPISTGLYGVRVSSPTPNSSTSIKKRLRSISNASTSSSISVISPATSSTNASATSLLIPGPRHHSRSRSRSASPDVDETVKLGPEYVLAMHDYMPQAGNATCLAFRAGQIIQVHNRDSSGWWDGELEGRRGWFPSNYVNAELVSLTEEEEPAEFRLSRRGHRYSHSQSSTTSWTTISSNNHPDTQRNRSLSLSQPSEDDGDPYCPPLMVPLLHGLSLLQNAVRSNRLAHFQPSTACIISCVRSILASTGTLQREAPILQSFTVLSDERRRILTILASLVAQAKRASEGNLEGDAQEIEVENMLRLGGQVFAHVRAFLAVAIECGVDLPEDQEAPATATIASETAQNVLSRDQNDTSDSPTKTPTQRGRSTHPVPRPDLHVGGPRSRERPTDAGSPNLMKTLARARQEQYLLRERTPGKHKNGTSISSVSSSSSVSSRQSVLSSPPPFPCGPSTPVQVLEALRYTHDHYLSTIAAFIGHVHTHSRSSHASSTGVLYDLVKEIVEMVCKLLTIVEAVMHHPDVPTNRVGNLKQAKEGLYSVTSSLAESVRLLTVSLPSSMSEEAEKQVLLRSATGAVQPAADCVAAVKICLSRSISDKPFIVSLPTMDNVMTQPLTPAVSGPPEHDPVVAGSYHFSGTGEENHTTQAQTSSPSLRSRQISSGSDNSSISKSSFNQSDETRATSPDTFKSIPPSLTSSQAPHERDLPSPTSFAHAEDDETNSEGRGQQTIRGLEESMVEGEVPPPPVAPIPEYIRDPTAWMFGQDYRPEDIAYNSEGHLVGATMDVLVEKMTPHDSIVDPAFAAVFFLTFRLFSSPLALVDAVISRYNLMPPPGISNEDLHLWQQKKGIPVRLRVSNFIKMWVELYWRSGIDDVALTPLTNFTREGLAIFFQGPAQRILDLLNMRRKSSDLTISPQLGERARDPGMSINPPLVTAPSGEIPRPLMTKTLLAALRKKDFSSISVTEFDPLELSRQITIMEYHLYCLIQPEEILESGQEVATPPVNVKAVTSLSTVITGWVAESILDEPDLKKRTALVKFFIKIADRCASLNNFSTSRSVLAALDSSVISRLRQTWAALPQKNKTLLETLRKLADHGRNYHEYRSKLRNTAPPAVPFLGLYLTDVTFCREGNPSLRASPLNANKKLINFNKYHKLARIMQDMQRFQVPYSLKAIPEVQEYLQAAFEKCKHHGDLQDLYRRSLLVEPKQPADAPPAMANDMRQLFSWATRSTQAS